MPSLERLYKEYGDRGSKLVAVEHRRRASAKTRFATFAKQLRPDVRGPARLDARDRAQRTRRRAIRRRSSSDRRERFGKKWIGADDWTSQGNRALIAQLLGLQTPRPVAETRHGDAGARRVATLADAPITSAPRSPELAAAARHRGVHASSCRSKATAVFLAIVLWFVVNAKEPQIELVPVRFTPVLDSSLVLREPLPQLQAIVAGSPKELIKLELECRRPFAGRSPPTRRTRVVLDLRPDDVMLPDGVDAVVRDVQPRSVTLRFESTRTRRCRCVSAIDIAMRAPASPVRSRRIRAGERADHADRGICVLQIASVQTVQHDDSLSRLAAASRRHRHDRARPGVRVKPAQVKVASSDARAPRRAVTRILGIETSCDETSAAVLEGSGDDVALRVARHPVAGRASHLRRRRAGDRVARAPHGDRAGRRASARRRRRRSDIDAVAVTNAPGLVGALLVGVSFAKAFAFARGIPVIGVHHMEGHLFATALEHPRRRAAVHRAARLRRPHAAARRRGVGPLPAARHDARRRRRRSVRQGREAARASVSRRPARRAARRATSDAGALRFARPMVRRDQQPGDADFYDVSFSGLKTAVLNAVKAPAVRRGPRRDRARVSGRADRHARREDGARRARSSAAGASCSAAAWRATQTLVAAMRERFAPRGVAGVRADAAARDGQRGDDRARRPLSPRARRAFAARPQRVRQLSPFPDSSPHDARLIADHPSPVQRSASAGFKLTGFGIAVLLAFLIAQIVSRARAGAPRTRHRGGRGERRALRRAARHAARREALLRRRRDAQHARSAGAAAASCSGAASSARWLLCCAHDPVQEAARSCASPTSPASRSPPAMRRTHRLLGRRRRLRQGRTPDRSPSRSRRARRRRPSIEMHAARSTSRFRRARIRSTVLSVYPTQLIEVALGFVMFAHPLAHARSQARRRLAVRRLLRARRDRAVHRRVLPREGRPVRVGRSAEHGAGDRARRSCSPAS